MSSVHDPDPQVALGELTTFRHELYECLSARADALFELTDCAVHPGAGPLVGGPVLAPEHRRGHGALYDGINHGRVDVTRLRNLVATQRLPTAVDGRIVLAVDVSPWLRPDASTSPGRSFCHTYGRGRDQHLMVPGWPYSIVAALETGATSWTTLLDAVRLAPDTDVAAITALQIREVVGRLIAAGRWQDGDPEILIVADAVYDAPRIAFLLGELPVQVLARMRSDGVLRRSAPARVPGTNGRPPKHGGEFVFGDPATWGAEQASTTTDTRRYGTARAHAWDRLHPRLTRRSAWSEHEGPLPIIAGTVIRLRVDHLPSGGEAKPVWLWWSKVDATQADVDRCWQAFLRRFDIEHTFRLFKQTLGWTVPQLRSLDSADRWTWLVIAAYTQLRLARSLAKDLRRPWEKPLPSQRLSPTRVRRGFRNIHAKTGSPAGAPKPSRPGPGRPPGSRNKWRAEVCSVGKTTTGTATMPNKQPKG
jgi:hypothetical protein